MADGPQTLFYNNYMDETEEEECVESQAFVPPVAEPVAQRVTRSRRTRAKKGTVID